MMRIEREKKRMELERKELNERRGKYTTVLRIERKEGEKERWQGRKDDDNWEKEEKKRDNKENDWL